MAQRQIKYQRDADPGWGRRVSAQPGCERLYSCTQCGNCSGTCPLSIYMDISPRRIMALVREGFRDDALRSQTIWLCTCCYACAADCPQKIGITDIMFSLKREAIENRIYPKRFPVPVLAQEFFKMVRAHGRSAEFWLTMRMALRTNPLALFSMLRLAWQLWRAGRLPIRSENIHRLTEFQGAIRRAKEGK
jgi:quinone-modifying oxidoreductase subunit QmoC